MSQENTLPINFFYGNPECNLENHYDLFILAISQVGKQLFDEMVFFSADITQKEKTLKALN